MGVRWRKEGSTKSSFLCGGDEGEGPANVGFFFRGGAENYVFRRGKMSGGQVRLRIFLFCGKSLG